jgi:DNA-binding beta-propeller fold protein YncE
MCRRPLEVESLEERLCPSTGYLFIDSYDTQSILRYDENTGAFVDQFVPSGSGGLYSSADMVIGSDHNLYVSNGVFSVNNQPNDVLRYDGATGAFLGIFAGGSQLSDPRGVSFGPDGNLYVADGNGPGDVVRFNGNTGAFIDRFVKNNSGGLTHPNSALFGPDGNLYVVSADQSEILQYNGQTGTFLGTFVPSGSGGLTTPFGMAFGPDGNLYVANTQFFDSTGGGILRFEGPSGSNPGAFLGTFIAPSSGGLLHPLSIAFGPEGDLYVASAQEQGSLIATPGTSTVLRYDGATGAFLGTFVTPDSGGLAFPDALIFSQTDPVTRNFDEGGEPNAPSTSLALAAAPGVRHPASAMDLASLATTLLNTGQGAAPALGPVAPSAPQASPNSVQRNSAAIFSEHFWATYAVFAASCPAVDDEGDSLLAPLVFSNLDAI